MAEISVAPQQQTRSGGEYQLSSSDRAAILAGSDSAMQAREIERQRQNFMLKNGDSDMPDLPDKLAH